MGAPFWKHGKTPFIIGAAFSLSMGFFAHLAYEDRNAENGRTYVVRGSSMSGILVEWQELRIRTGGVKKGDVVVLKTWIPSPERIVKRVMATEGDRFEYRAGNLSVNGAVLKTSDGKPYRVDSKMLEAYAAEYPTVPKRAILVMWNLPGGTYDSSAFGFSDVSDVIGIVEK